MKILKQTIMMLAICSLPVASGRAQGLAAFKVPDSPRAFVFNLRSPSEVVASTCSTNAAPRGVEGLQTVLAKRFKTTQHSGVVTITFYDAVVCQAHRRKGKESSSSVMVVAELSIDYPAGTSVLVYENYMRLADLSEKSFNPPTPHYQTNTGEEAVKKLNEMGLDPPDDMDQTPEKSKSGK
jgi:hypothetical protein